MLLALFGFLLPMAQAQTAGQVRYFPRTGYEYRMVGGQFQGSQDNTTWTTFYTVTAAPSDVYTTAATSANPQTFRYLRYLAPDGTFGNVAEIEFDSGTGTSAVKLTGMPFGTPGSYYGSGNDLTKAFDGNISTFFDAPYPGNGDFVGIDQGTPPSTGQVRFAPRPSFGYRMVGGIFQGSADGMTYTTLATVSLAPPDSQYTVLPTSADPAAFRYLRYLAPDGTFGNIAELEFDSNGAKLAGTLFGTPDSYYGSGNDITKVFDGDTSTFFDAPYPGNGDFVGIDQGSAPVLTSITVSPASVTGGNPSTGTVTLTSPAAASGATVSLTSDNTSATAPASVTIAAGAVSATFPITTTAVTATAIANITATYNGVSKSAALTIYPVLSLTAAATGTNKITLYWNGISGASGYDIYRSTVSGGPYTQIAQNVTTPDNGPGLTSAFVYSDSAGLTTGTEYFYVVWAVQSGAETTQSNEASDTPQAGAVPWDTGDPVQIIAAETAQVSAVLPPDIDPDTGDYVSADVGLLTAEGPNGVIYEGPDADGNPATSYASPGYYDAVNSQIVYTDGTTQPVQSDSTTAASASTALAASDSVLSMPFLQPQALQQNLSFQFPPSRGIEREVLSQPGYVGLSTTQLVFPSPGLSPGSIQLSASGKPGQTDSADVYTGGLLVNPTTGAKVRGSALDAGLTLMTSNPVLDPAWAPTIQGQFNKAFVTAINRPHSAGDGITGNQRILLYSYPGNPLQMSFVTGGQDRRYLQGRVALHFKTNYKLIVREVDKDPTSPTNRKILTPNAPLRYGSITFTSAQPVWTYQNGPRMQIKRSNSIAQNIAAGTPQLQNYSFMYECAWGGDQSDDRQGMLFQFGAGYVSWDQTPQVTYHAGGYPNPNTSVVFFRANAPFHSEDTINLSTTPDSTLPGR